jgi:hypothetical protein
MDVDLLYELDVAGHNRFEGILRGDQVKPTSQTDNLLSG